MIVLATHTEDGTPVHPAFLPTAAFTKWLSMLPPTPALARKLAAQGKEEAKRREIEGQERQRFVQEEREKRAILAADREADRGPIRRGWASAPKAKHVVLGRLHLIEDDDIDDRRGRTGYIIKNRFTTGA